MKRYGYYGKVVVWLLALTVLGGCLPNATPTQTPLPTVTPTATPALEKLFVEPNDGVDALLQAIESARKRIQITVYLLTYHDIINALESAARRGVKVQVILEGYPYGGGNNLGVIKALQSHGVEAKTGNPAFHYTHQKTVTIDNRLAFLMTSNLTYSAFHNNREFMVLIRDPAKIAEINEVFAADWERRPPKLDHPKLVWSPVNSRSVILGLINSAHKRIEMYQEEMYDREVVDALITAAEKRHLDIRVIGPYREDDNGEWMTLSRHGVHVHRIEQPFVHAKVILVDGKVALIGSMNISETSLDFNRELGLVTRDPAIMNRLQRVFAEDWQRPAH